MTWDLMRLHKLHNTLKLMICICNLWFSRFFWFFAFLLIFKLKKIFSTSRNIKRREYVKYNLNYFFFLSPLLFSLPVFFSLYSDSDRSIMTYNGEVCPICLGAPKIGVKAPCGHLLCADCLASYCDVRIAPAPPPCPLCRAPLNSVALACDFVKYKYNIYYRCYRCYRERDRALYDGRVERPTCNVIVTIDRFRRIDF